MSEILTIKNLEKSYISASENLTVLRNLNFSMTEGTSAVIVGKSGSGKSTLLNIIGGIDKATAGSVIAGKWNVTELSEKMLSEYRLHFIGLIFQFHYLLKDFTALENIYIPYCMAGGSKKEGKKRAIQLLSDVGLENRMNHLPSQLSGGERQRVAVARALVNDPKLILADEPTGSLDPENAKKIAELLFSMTCKYSKSLLLVTHDMGIASMGEKVFYIDENGSLQQTESGDMGK